MVPRFLVYSHDDTQLFELDPDQVVSASSTEEINGEHSLTISTMQLLEKEQRILVQDGTLKWREYVVTGIDAEHTDGVPVHTYYCVWSLQHDLMATKVNKQPGIRNPVSARVALTSALDGTERWTVGTVTRNTSGGVSMYYMSGWEALSKVVEVWGGEVDVTIGVANSGVVSRRVDLYDKQGSAEAVRRFDYGSDIESIKRTVSDEPFVCRIIPRGKGEETEGGGYGRRITIASVNGGIEWLEDAEAVPLVRLPDGQGGWEYPTLIVLNENIDDPQALKDWALEHIHDYTRPKVTYSASVVQFAEAGMDTQGIELGDTVQCVDRTFTEDGLRITGRVVRLVTNELDRRDVEVEVGFLKGTIASQFQSLQSSVETVSAYLDTLANDMSTPEWIDGLIDRINREVNATGGYTYIVEGHGIRTYDKAVTDPAVGAEADAVVEIKGGTIRIANSRDGQGNWEWKTVFTSGHIAGDLVTAAQITTGYIGSAGGTFIDLDNDTVQLGESSGTHLTMSANSINLYPRGNGSTAIEYPLYARDTDGSQLPLAAAGLSFDAAFVAGNPKGSPAGGLNTMHVQCAPRQNDNSAEIRLISVDGLGCGNRLTFNSGSVSGGRRVIEPALMVREHDASSATDIVRYDAALGKWCNRLAAVSTPSGSVDFYSSGTRHATLAYTGSGDALLSSPKNVALGVADGGAIERQITFKTNGEIQTAQLSAISDDAAPQTSESANPLTWRDGKSNIIGQIRALHETDGRIGSALVARRLVGANVVQNVIAAYVDNSGARTYYVSDAPAFRDAIYAQRALSVSATTPTFTNAGGFTVSDMSARKYGNVVQIMFSVENTNAMTANTNYTVAVLLAEEYRPAIEASLMSRRAGVVSRASITTGGDIVIMPNSNVGAGGRTYYAGTYITAQ